MLENRRLIQVNGVEICIETRGNLGAPAILLIHGAAASMLGWPDDLVQDLANAGRFVIRYDHRDTGQSTSFPPGAPPYNLRDLAADAVGILDALALERANIVGISMGGGIGQLLAVEFPERVASLTLMATSPGGPDLPPPSDEFLSFVQNRVDPDWSDREAVIEHVLEMMRVFGGGLDRVDESRLHRMLEADIARSTADPVSMQVNHFMVDPGEPVRPKLSQISVPTVVMHGSDDPVFPISHAQVLAEEIPGARLVPLEDVGHLIPWQAKDAVVSEIVTQSQGVQA